MSNSTTALEGLSSEDEISSNVNYKGMAVFAVFASVILFMCSGIFFYFAVRGTGFKYRRPHSKTKAPEENMLSGMATCITGVVWFSRAVLYIMHSGGHDVAFNIEDYRYYDYLLSCPMLVLDVCFITEQPFKWTITLLTALTLFIGAISVNSNKPETFAYFALGCVFFAMQFYWLFRNLYRRLADYPKNIRIYLKLGMYTFITVWPMFPILYVIGPRIAGFISLEADTYVHGFLDICAKGLYGAFLTRFRLCIEDTHNEQHYLNGGAHSTEPDTHYHAGGRGDRDNNGMSCASSQAGGKREAFAQRLEDVRVNIGSDMLPVQTRNVFVPALGGGNGNMDGDAYQLSQAEPGEALDMRALPHSQSPSMQHGHTGNGYVPSRPAPSVSGRQSVVAQSVRAGEQRRPPPSGDEVYMMLRNFNALVNGMLSGYEEPAAASEAHDS
eukprot:Opistho-2@24581